jgi:hypothetical protein
MKNKKVILPTIVVGLALATTGAFVGVTRAANGNGNGDDNLSSQLAKKLNLDQAEVQTAVDQVREENQATKQAERQQQLSENLDQAVKDGVITADQKQLLLDKQTAIQAEMEKQRSELEQWYSDNGIDQEKLNDYDIGFGSGPGGHGRPGHD